jgi:hypothetical protein
MPSTPALAESENIIKEESKMGKKEKKRMRDYKCILFQINLFLMHVDHDEIIYENYVQNYT